MSCSADVTQGHRTRGAGGETSARAVARLLPGAHVPALVLTFWGNRPSSERTLQLGAARMISKEAHVGEIFDAIGELGGLGDY